MTTPPSENRDALTRRRIAAVDKALTAMVTTIRDELPGDTALLEGFRSLASRARQQLLAAFPNAAED